MDVPGGGAEEKQTLSCPAAIDIVSLVFRRSEFL